MAPKKLLRLVIFVKGYPRLSETFVAQEIRLLERAGFDVQIVSLRHPTDSRRHPVHDEITAPVIYLPEYIRQEIGRCIRGWLRARRLPNYKEVRRIWVRDFVRDPTPNRARRFFQACVAATEVRGDWFYGHFIHTPGSVTRYAALMLGLPFSFSAHAKDIWLTPEWELVEKLGDARWTTTCTKNGADYLDSLTTNESNPSVYFFPHGIDLSVFTPFARELGTDGSDSSRSLRLLTVGRAVEKKGLDVLVESLSLLPQDIVWRWTHIGGGPLAGELKERAKSLGLLDRVEFLGACSQAEILSSYRSSDLFVLPCRIASDGDRDGLPNVLVESLSQSLSVITTPVSAIPDFIEDGVNGVLVPPDNPQKLSAAIIRLGRDPALRLRLGESGSSLVAEQHNSERVISGLVDLFAVQKNHKS